MKFIENFKTHQVEGNQRIVSLSYLEFTNPKKSNWLSEGEASMSEFTIRPQTLEVQLENKTMTSKISNQQIEDLNQVGIDAIEQIKKELKTEQSINIQKHILVECDKIARFKFKWEINQNKGGVRGIRRWFWDLFNYHPEIWIESDDFLNVIFKMSHEISKSSRVGAGNNWIVVNPSTLYRFEKCLDFQYERGGTVTTNDIISHVGNLRYLKVFTSHLVEKTQIIMGRGASIEHDNTISIVKGESELLQTETIENQSFKTFQKIRLRTPIKIFSFPDSANNYLQWKFQYEKPSLRKYLKEISFRILKL